MGLPPLTHLQFAVLSGLMGSRKSGRELRRELAGMNVRKSGPAFYQLMARMEDAGLVEGWYEKKTVGDQVITERWYTAKGAGVRAFNDTRDFFMQAPRAGRGRDVALA